MNLQDIVATNKCLKETIYYLKHYHREKVYIVAGAVTQTVWNFIYGNNPDYGIEDFDFIYYYDKDLSESAERQIIKDITNGLGHIPLKLDIKNQARVHLWYKAKFGYEIMPIKSIEDAIDRFTTTATAVGMGYNEFGKLCIYAPFGLDDLYSGILRANKKQVTETEYMAKVNKWINKWPKLQVTQW
jgi:hypothetical protein